MLCGVLYCKLDSEEHGVFEACARKAKVASFWYDRYLSCMDCGRHSCSRRSM